MFIKKLLINGFKSFADKTVVEFKDGLNIILGPNGCGKSNVIDAIRWVLGEQRLKTLRAGKSEDIIFGGSEDRKPSSYAQVSFYLNNDPKVINSDFPEVEVTRKLFRSGDSEYLINKKECRLKDILELFMDTGLGKGSYSIIQQGQIDQILSSKAEERRMIFEEAAGIARSKVLVKESRQKLVKTEENLSRLYDILGEVEKQAGSLQVQAEKAMEYRKLRQFLSETDKKIFFSRYSQILSKISAGEEKGNAFKEKIEILKQGRSEVYNEIEDVIEEVSVAEGHLEEFREDEKKLEMDEYKTNQEIKVLREEYERLKKSHEKMNQKKKEMERRKDEMEAFFKSREDQEQELNESLWEYEARHDELTSQLIELEEDIQELSDKIVARRQENKEMDSEIAGIIQKQKEVFQELVNSIEQKRSNISRTLQEKNQLKEEIGQSLTHLDGFFQKWDFLFSSSNFDNEHFPDMMKDLGRFNEHLKTFKGSFFSYESTVQEILDFFEKDGDMVFNADYEYKIQSLRDKIELNQHEIFEMEENLNSRRKSRDTVIRVQSENQIELNKIREKQIALVSERDKLAKELEVLNAEFTSLDREIEDTFLSMDEVESDVFSLIDSYEAIRSKQEELESKKARYQQSMMTNTKRLKELEHQQKEMANELETVSRRMDQIVLNYKESLFKKEMVEKNYFEKYGKDISDIYNPDEVESIDEKALESEMRSAKNKLNSIGAVNLLAIDEYEEVKERLDFLTQNKNDMEQARADLEQLINEVHTQATESFLEIFGQIQKNFETVFKKAFNGGKCKLKLEDPDNPLESGIDIIAQPPGKKLQNIFQMSGGERSMTALSIMFAIFMVKPSPFCLLDEVDAALDEANVERLGNIINEFSHQTQFIMITHNRISAQKGNVFYGITMQQPGVTKVFSFDPDNLKDENIA